jgi:PAS domain S-box-containing protein
LASVSAASLAFITFYPAIMVSAWLGGLGPGLATTLLSAVAAKYFWMDPRFTLYATNAGDAIALVAFALVRIFISGVTGAMHRARRRQARALEQAQRAGAAVAASEERLRVTIASIGDAVIATDTGGAVTTMNAVAQSLTGWSDAAAVGRPLAEVFTIVNEHSHRPVEHPVDRVLREGKITGLANHTILIARDGREIPIDDSAAPIRDAAGTLVGVVLVFRDISLRRQVEQRLQLALEAGRMGTWEWTIARGTVTWSSSLEAIHGFPPGSFPGTVESVRAAIHPDDRDRVLPALAEAVEGRRDHRAEYRIVRRDGAIRWVGTPGSSSATPRGSPSE